MRKLTLQLLSLIGLVSVLAVNIHATTQTIGNNHYFSNWGLDRIDQRFLPFSRTFTYNNTGAGVNVYILDNGVNVFHNEFGGRAQLAYDATFDGGFWSACDDHGTHVTGIIGGATYGVAKQANLFAVKVATCQQNPQGGLQPVINDDALIRGLDWVLLNHVKPAVVNLSFARNLRCGNDCVLVTNATVQIEERIKALVNLGVTVVAGAGNIAQDAKFHSPARIPQVITVSGSDWMDKRDVNAAYGNLVDIYAPGVFILSASNASPGATAIKTGTSMSTAFVTGVVAQYLQSNPLATPAQVDQFIKQTATYGVIPDPYDGSNKNLLFTAQ
ncbi:MAG: S8 family peptidase [Pyrinomonadaceae bacterium]|nr:S8 family peptidase [Pyrinomonadaceae bacterium]